MAVVLGVVLLSGIGFLIIRGITRPNAPEVEGVAETSATVASPAARPVVLPSATAEPEAPSIDVDSLPAVDAGSRPRKRRAPGVPTKKAEPGYGRFE